MTEDQLEAKATRPWYRAELVVFVVGSVCVAAGLVLVSMALYNSSGAAQLDLSRPGYKAVQDKVDQTDTFKSFPATGSVNSKTIDDFQKLYSKQVQQVTANSAFDPAVLDDQALGIDAPSGDE